MKYYKYKYANNTRSVVCREGSCLICKHCTSVCWDYSNGPYMTFCELEVDMESCNTFELREECEEVIQ